MSEEKYRSVVERASDGVAIIQDGIVKYVNTRAMEMTGYSLEQVIDAPFTDYIHPDELDEALEYYNRRLKGDKVPTLYERTLRHKDGRKIHTEINGTLITYEERPADLVIIRDVTERWRADQALRESETRFRELVDSAPDAIVIVDSNGRIRLVNRQVEEVFGYDVEELRGQPHDILLPERFQQVHAKHRARYFSDPYARPMGTGLELAGRRKDGTEFPVDISLSPLETIDGRQVISVIRDVTERKQAEEELRRHRDHLEGLVSERTTELERAMAKAQEADRLKSAFLASMSHELRTPLNSIIGFSGILLQGLPGPLNPEQTKQLGIVRDSANNLLSLINDILDISKIEAGQLEVSSEPFSMPDVIDKVSRTIAPMAEKKGLAVIMDVAPDVGELLSDGRRVEQILINLVNNAIKFTEKGEVKVQCRVADGSMVTRVKDTGIGIAAHEMEKLFKAFYQTETGLARRYEGTGLGLSICKKLVEMLGGQIWAESDGPGKGSTFAFRLPLV